MINGWAAGEETGTGNFPHYHPPFSTFHNIHSMPIACTTEQWKNEKNVNGNLAMGRGAKGRGGSSRGWLLFSFDCFLTNYRYIYYIIIYEYIAWLKLHSRIKLLDLDPPWLPIPLPKTWGFRAFRIPKFKTRSGTSLLTVGQSAGLNWKLGLG